MIVFEKSQFIKSKRFKNVIIYSIINHFILSRIKIIRFENLYIINIKQSKIFDNDKLKTKFIIII